MLPHPTNPDFFDLESFLNMEKKENDNMQVDGVENEYKKNTKKKPKSELKKRTSSIHLSGKKAGHWDLQENKKYHWFLEIYHSHFLKKHMRRVDRIFKVMEIFLGTREAQQCRSHHQKMEKKHKYFKNILLHLRRQHYQSQQTQSLRQDLEEHNIQMVDGLLQRYQLDLSESKQDQKSEENEEAPLEQQSIVKLEQEGKFLDNLMDDEYSHCIDLHEFFS